MLSLQGTEKKPSISSWLLLSYEYASQVLIRDAAVQRLLKNYSIFFPSPFTSSLGHSVSRGY